MQPAETEPGEKTSVGPPSLTSKKMFLQLAERVLMGISTTQKSPRILLCPSTAACDALISGRPQKRAHTILLGREEDHIVVDALALLPDVHARAAGRLERERVAAACIVGQFLSGLGLALRKG